LKQGDAIVGDVRGSLVVEYPKDRMKDFPPRADAISPDLSTIKTPVHRSDGRQSYNLPNDAPSRTWFSRVATRNDSSPFTTCP
jgi:hypothetical protein